MAFIDWDSHKNEQLRQERDISFEDVLIAIDEGRVLDVIEHTNRTRYPNQRIIIVDIAGYAFLVPYVEDDEKIFLKTIIPSRKATRDYLLAKDKRKKP